MNKSQIVFTLLVILFLSALIFFKITKDNRCESICSPDVSIQYTYIGINYYCICDNKNNVYFKELK
jgi:hypothetical protein